MKIFLVRHGRVQPSEGRRYIGWTDSPLSPEGLVQAEGLRDEFLRLSPARIVSSDLSRARITAEIIAAGHGVAVELEAGLREVHLGDWEGRSFDQVRADFPTEYERRGLDLAGHRPPGGESFRDLRERAAPIFERLVAETAGDLMIVGHHGVFRVLLCELLGMPTENLFRLRLDCASVATLVKEGERMILTGLGRGRDFGD